MNRIFEFFFFLIFTRRKTIDLRTRKDDLKKFDIYQHDDILFWLEKEKIKRSAFRNRQIRLNTYRIEMAIETKEYQNNVKESNRLQVWS